jgi:uncharacterized protein (TIGR02246 family)
MSKGSFTRWTGAVVLSAAMTATPLMAQEEDVGRTLDDVYERFSEGYRRGDPAAVAALYADDAFYLAPGGDMTRGEIASHFAWLSSFDPGSGPRIEFEIVDRDVQGDLAYDIGYYRIRPADAPEAEGSRGTFIVIWKRGGDGVWRIHADGYSEAPASGKEGA